MVNVTCLNLPGDLTPESLATVLRTAGATFAFVHGSRAAGRERPDSDVDVAAWFGQQIRPWELDLPAAVDLLVLDSAGLELSGRVAQYGVLILDDDPPVRVAWQADRSKRYLDDSHRRHDLVRTVFGDG